MKTPNSIRFGLLAAAALFTHTAFAANGPKPPPPPPPPSLENWQTVDDFTDGANYALTVAPNGAMFAAGWGGSDQEGYYGLIRASVDGGNTWFSLSSFLYPGLLYTICTGIAS